MASVTSYTATRMKAIEDASVVDGEIDAFGHLILTRYDDSQIDAGSVQGPQGPIGIAPTGTPLMWLTDTPPEGFLLCDGSAVSRAFYNELFAVIGTTFGVGDGSTTFNLPDFQGRVPVGLDSGQTEFDTLGKTGGEKTHVLTLAEIPAHDHGGATGTGYTVFMRVVSTSGTGASATQTAGWASGSYVDVTNTSSFPGSSHTHSIASEGSGAAHNNLQPYFVVNYIIKT